MINYEKKVPECYLINSRDFQLLVRLLTVGLSGAKHDSSTLLHINNPDIINTISLPLLLTKVGIVDSKYQYTDKQMIHICKCFKDIVRKKGTLKSVEELCKLYSACNDVTVDVVQQDKNSIYITYYGTVDVKLLESLIQYVLPVGCIYTIQNVEFTDYTYNLTTKDDMSTYIRIGKDRALMATDSNRASETQKINTSEIYRESTEKFKTWQDAYGSETNPIKWATHSSSQWGELLYDETQNGE